MLVKLNNHELKVAKQMKVVFHSSYAVEAALLNATDFPPLKRDVADYRSCKNDFYGCMQEDELAGVVEVKQEVTHILIQSLVVAPKHFRKGIGARLVAAVFNYFPSELYKVETGAANKPAIALYEKFGFKITETYMTTVGILKVRMSKS